MINIDTVHFRIQLPNHQVDGTTHFHVTNDDGEILRRCSNWVTLKHTDGLHSLRYRTVERITGITVEIETSPYAFVFGQNVFTNSNLYNACTLTLRKFISEFNIPVSNEVKMTWLQGDIELTRVDLAKNFRFSSTDEGQRFLKQLRVQFSQQNCSTWNCKTSVYWNPQMGRKYSICFYDKSSEMTRKIGASKSKKYQRLLSELDGIVRVELRLKRPELKELGLARLSSWTESIADTIFDKYFDRLPIMNVTWGKLSQRALANVTARMRPVLALHKRGVSLSDVYSERSVRRHHKYFRSMGIDLRCLNQQDKSMKLKSLLSEKRLIKQPPQWMIDKDFAPSPSVSSNMKWELRKVRSRS